MKVVLVAAITADGLIARDSSQTSTDWTSTEDKKHFVALTKELGTIVLGATTFATIGRALPGRRMIVMTTHPERIQAEGVEAFDGSVAELVHRLQGEGVPALAVIGGSRVYAQFLASALVDEVVLTVEPHLFGTGIGLADQDLDVSMQLTKLDRLGQNGIVLHYKIDR